MKLVGVDIHGRIPGYCQNCSRMVMCYCFTVNGEKKIKKWCKQCLKKVYHYPQKKYRSSRFREYFYCKDCGFKARYRLAGEERITETHVIQVFKCEECGQLSMEEIKKWRRKK